MPPDYNLGVWHPLLLPRLLLLQEAYIIDQGLLFDPSSEMSPPIATSRKVSVSLDNSLEDPFLYLMLSTLAFLAFFRPSWSIPSSGSRAKTEVKWLANGIASSPVPQPKSSSVPFLFNSKSL